MKTASRYSKSSYKTTVIAFVILINFVVYFYSGVDKLIHFNEFVLNFSKSPFAPSDLINELSFCVVGIELGICFLCFFNKFQKLACLLFMIMSYVFSGYVLLMITYSPYLPCSCGGLIDFLTWNEHLALNISLTTISGYATIISE